jgi:hypothetical protein
VAAGHAQLDYHLAMLNAEAMFLRKPNCDGLCRWPDGLGLPIMQRDAETFGFDEDTRMRGGEDIERFGCRVERRRTDRLRGHSTPAMLVAMAPRHGQAVSQRSKHFIELRKRTAADNRYPSDENDAKAGQQIAQGIVGNNRVGPLGNLDQLPSKSMNRLALSSSDEGGGGRWRGRSPAGI